MSRNGGMHLHKYMDVPGRKLAGVCDVMGCQPSYGSCMHT
jgi:hypothetical protein